MMFNRISGRPPRPAEIRFADPEADDAAGFEVRVGAAIAGLFFLGFLGWASLARLDSAAYAQGFLAVAGHAPVLQRDVAAKIAKVLVHEGDHVTQGQVLITFSATETSGAEGALAGRVADLEARKQRLLAELGGSRPGSGGRTAQNAILQASQAGRAEQAEADRRKIAALISQSEGYKQEIASQEAQARSIAEELSATRALEEKGYASTNRVRALERTDAALRGALAELRANAARVDEDIHVTQAQSQVAMAETRERDARELQDVEEQLSDLRPRLKALQAQLADLSLRAPVTGRVSGLAVFNGGSVATPGQKLLEITPDGGSISVQARLKPEDAGDLRLGQEVEIRLPTLGPHALPILKARLTRLSPDLIIDDRTNERYFAVEASTPSVETATSPSTLLQAMRPGLPAQVILPKRRRTLLEYLVEPLSTSLWRALREP